MPDSPVIAPPTPTVADNETCYHCGYDLQSLSRDSACPECGFPIAVSRGARGLARAGLTWLRGARRGTVCLLAASAVFPVFVGMMWGPAQGALAKVPFGLRRYAIDIVFLVACIIAAAGCWWLMRHPPHTPPTLRDRVLKGLVALILVLAASVAVQDQCTSFGLWTPLKNVSTTSPFVMGVLPQAAVLLIPAIIARTIAIRAAEGRQKDLIPTVRAFMWMALALPGMLAVLIAVASLYFTFAAPGPAGIASTPATVIALAACLVPLYSMVCFVFWVVVLFKYLSRVHRAITDMRDSGGNCGPSSNLSDGACSQSGQRFNRIERA